MKRADLKKIVDRLATDVVPFAVFPSIDEVGSLFPHERGTARAYIAWSKEADRALDHEAPFAFHWGGGRARLSMAFAKAGFAARIDAHSRDHNHASRPVPADLNGAREVNSTRPSEAELNRDDDSSGCEDNHSAQIDARLLKAYHVVGTGVVASVVGDTDLMRMLRSFSAMRKDGVVALPCAGGAQSDGWSEVAEAAKSETQTAVFWTEHGHDAFDEVGKLSRLHLYWRGDASRIAQHLRAEGFFVVEPNDESHAIEVTSASRALAIPRFSDVLPDEAFPATKPSAPKQGHRAGSFEVLARGSSTQPLPIACLALHSARMALAHGYDQRGWPEAVATVIDARSGNVVRTFAGQNQIARAQSMTFLRDGRLAFGVSDFVERASCTPTRAAPVQKSTPGRRVAGVKPATSSERVPAVVARLWDPTTDSESALRAHALQNGPGVEIFGVTADAQLGVMPSCEGALVFSLTTGEEVARVGEKIASYPISAISPDGNAVLWTHDGGPANVYAVDGTLLFSGEAPQSFFSVIFDPTSRYLLVGCREFHRGSREERSIQVYSLSGDRAFPAVEAAAIGAQSIVLNSDASVLAVGQRDGVIRLIDFPSARARGEGHVLDASITALAYADDGRLVAGDAHGRYVILREIVQP